MDAETTAKVLELAAANPQNIGLNSFDAEYAASLDDALQARLAACLRSGIENPDSKMGCYAMQPADYDELKPFFAKALAAYHGVPEDAAHATSWSMDGVEGLPDGGALDLAALGMPALSMRVRVGRNLAGFPLPGAMTEADRLGLEAKMLEAFGVLIADPQFGGRYNSITPEHPNEISLEEYDALVGAHIMFKDMSADSYLVSAGIASDWPAGRGCYVSEDNGFVIWVGEEDHLRIMCMKKGTVLNEVFDRLQSALAAVEGIEGIEFAASPDYGYVTSCPTNLGTGMRASVHLPLPVLTADGEHDERVVGELQGTVFLPRFHYVSHLNPCLSVWSLRPARRHREPARPVGPRPGRRAHRDRGGRDGRHLAAGPVLHHRGRDYRGALPRARAALAGGGRCRGRAGGGGGGRRAGRGLPKLQGGAGDVGAGAGGGGAAGADQRAAGEPEEVVQGQSAATPAVLPLPALRQRRRAGRAADDGGGHRGAGGRDPVLQASEEGLGPPAVPPALQSRRAAGQAARLAGLEQGGRPCARYVVQDCNSGPLPLRMSSKSFPVCVLGHVGQLTSEATTKDVSTFASRQICEDLGRRTERAGGRCGDKAAMMYSAFAAPDDGTTIEGGCAAAAHLAQLLMNVSRKALSFCRASTS
eukprot:SAG22_NODE_70_length_22717_cov_12.413741_4_plen_645_part_00